MLNHVSHETATSMHYLSEEKLASYLTDTQDRDVEGLKGPQYVHGRVASNESDAYCQVGQHEEHGLPDGMTEVQDQDSNDRSLYSQEEAFTPRTETNYPRHKTKK